MAGKTFQVKQFEDKFERKNGRWAKTAGWESEQLHGTATDDALRTWVQEMIQWGDAVTEDLGQLRKLITELTDRIAVLEKNRTPGKSTAGTGTQGR